MTKNITDSGSVFWTYGPDNPTQTVVLIHGYRGTHHGLEEIAQELAKKDLGVIVPDIPGFGEGKVLEHYHLSDYTKWLKEFIGEINLPDKPHLLGHSFGSIIVSSFVAEQADMIDRLILLNPIPHPVNQSKTIIDFFGNGYYRVGQRLPQPLAIKWFSSKLMTLIASEFMIKNRSVANRRHINNEHLSHFSEFASIQALVKSYQTSSVNSVKEYAPLLKNQTLIIAGDKDDIAPLKKQLILEKEFADAKLSVINNVGHLTHYETPKEVASMVHDFIK